MARIKNTEGLSTERLHDELRKGVRLVAFSYPLSVIVITSRRTSDICFIKADEASSGYSWKYSLLTLFFGWRAIPFGPIFSQVSSYEDFTGGKEVTREVLNPINAQFIES